MPRTHCLASSNNILVMSTDGKCSSSQGRKIISRSCSRSTAFGFVRFSPRELLQHSAAAEVEIQYATGQIPQAGGGDFDCDSDSIFPARQTIPQGRKTAHHAGNFLIQNGQTSMEFLHCFEVLVSTKSDWTFLDRDNIWASFTSWHVFRYRKFHCVTV